MMPRRFVICTLPNGNLNLLTRLSKRAGLPWDCILSAEVFRAYKLDPRTYLGVAQTFDVSAHQVMLAATHHDDLESSAPAVCKQRISKGRSNSVRAIPKM